MSQIYYYDKDVNMMNYLGSKIECYVLNKLIKDNITENQILSHGSLSKIVNVKLDLFEKFYSQIVNNTSTKAKIRYYDQTFNLQNNIDFSDVNSSVDTSARISITQTQPIYNLTYDYSYLTNTDFNPNLFDKDKGVPLLYLLSFIAPKIYLEICSSNVNNFFVNLFQDYKNGVPIKSGQTLNTINSWCKDSPYVSYACAADKSNPRCACQKCYNKHSYQNRMIAKQLLDSDSSNTDPWCYYPDCAKGSAIKNQLGVNRSVCSNLSVAGIFVNPSEYSNVNISNTEVSASAYNNNGINITSNEGCNSCTSNQHCLVKNNQITCVDNSSVSQENKLGEKSSSSSHSIYLILTIIIGVFIAITAVVSFILHKNPAVKFISTPVIVILCIFFAVMLYLHQTTKEPFTFPDYFANSRECDQVGCYSDTDCDGSAIKGQVCLNNNCDIPIGTFLDDNGNITDFPKQNETTVFDCIITNLLYAPKYLYTGNYLYSVFIKNVLYAFAENCTLSFDGTKWVEKAIRSDQSGFNPYVPKKISPSNPKSFYYYNNNVYLPTKSNNNQLSFNVYNTLDDYWDILSLPINPDINFMGIDQQNIYIYTNDEKMYVYDIDTKKIANYHVSNADGSQSSFIKLFILSNNMNVIYFINNNFQIYTWTIGDNKFMSYDTEDSFIYFTIIDIDVDTAEISYIQYDHAGYFNRYYIYNISNKKVIDNITFNTLPDPNIDIPNLLVCQNNNSSNIKYKFIMTQSGEIFRLYVDKTVNPMVLYINSCYGITNFDIPRNFPF